MWRDGANKYWMVFPIGLMKRILELQLVVADFLRVCVGRTVRCTMRGGRCDGAASVSAVGSRAGSPAFLDGGAVRTCKLNALSVRVESFS